MQQLLTMIALVMALALPSQVSAAGISLAEIVFNRNGTLYQNNYAVPGLNSAAWNTTTGLGTLTLTFNPGAPGAYFFDIFMDHDLHVPIYNEFGSVLGAPSAGVSWQIDVPGSGDANRKGTIFTNTSTNALDNQNHVPGTVSNALNNCGANGGGAVNPNCNNDVSLAMGFNFILGANEFALITITTSTGAPGGGFALRQQDPDTPSALYLTGTLSFQEGGTTPVPEPGSLLLLGMGAGLAGLAGAARSRRHRIR